MPEWRKSTWGDEISLEYGKGIRGYADAKGPFRVYGTNGPVGWTSEPLASGPGIILGRKGAYRGVAFSENPFFVIDTAYYVVPKKDLDMRWIYYAMLHHKLGEIDDGSPIPSTTRAAVYVRDLDVPSLDEQRAISGLLGALDDKIRGNIEVNETLDALVAALFRDWFLDYGPTYSKVEAKQPYLASNLWDLFPAKCDGTGCPVGWTTKSIKQTTSAIQYGLTQSAKQTGSGPKFLRITDIQGGRVNWSSVPLCEANAEEEDKYRLETGDVVVARTGASTGESFYVVDPPRSVFASYLVRFQFAEKWTARLVAQYMRSPEYRAFVGGSVGGSAQPNASAQLLASASLIVPDPKIGAAFYELVSPMDTTKRENERENGTLAELRDLLLAKLMSKEIEVAVAEKQVEELL